MSRNGKVIVAMSGGVDSSVAAGLLKEQGYECVGVFMRVGVHAPQPRQANAVRTDADEHGRHGRATQQRGLRHGCCSVEDAIDARAIAGRLGIRFYALNFEQDFDRIVDYFVDEYCRARTPNPCIMCNTHLKFGKLLRYADVLDAEFVATGHYARIVGGNVGRSEGENVDVSSSQRVERRGMLANLSCDQAVYLARSLNRAKDQSYVLFGIRRDDLPRCLFPLGEIADKAEVRRIAAGLGLRVHDKPESQEICFVPDNEYRRLVQERRPGTRQSGEVRDSAGNVLGTHEGVASYTIGQRRGLGIATGKPVYVTRLDVATNTVTVGPREELLNGGLVADQVNWLTDPPPAGGWCPAEIKIRHMHTPAAGRIRLRPDGEVEASFDELQPAVTPGQAAVFYEGELVLGGGWIRGP
ncbi:MAG TPA: tRNA 2-thiouridine(34) synthase MnmA [Phycisphaerae bacterium]|nr:tRNA 2-thiouridine(34) synthase MnmA [Phycisphaerae bacterium]